MVKKTYTLLIHTDPLQETFNRLDRMQKKTVQIQKQQTHPLSEHSAFKQQVR